MLAAWEFIKEYDHVLSACCDIICTVVMLAGIIKNRARIETLETQVCPKTGRKEKKRK